MTSQSLSISTAHDSASTLSKGDARRHFISIVGCPPPPSEQRTSPVNAIVPSNNPEEIVDVLDAEDEDPFTLETFEAMLKLHMQKEIDFIIARVKTADPEDEDRFYYSYYAAHHINKVLFRTQPDEGLLHRMRAKNPLNNMPIVGDVHYFVIKANKDILERVSPNIAETPEPQSPIS